MPRKKTIRRLYIDNGQAHQFLSLFWRKGRGEYVSLTRRELDDAMRRAGVKFERELWHDLVDTGCLSVKPIYGARKEHVETVCTLTLDGMKLVREFERPTNVRRVKPAGRPRKYVTAPWLDPAAIRAPVREVSP